MPTPAPITDSDPEVWVKAVRIARLFDVDTGSVYRGEGGMDQIRSAYIPGTKQRGRKTRRFYWPDALAMRDQMLESASPGEVEEVPVSIRAFLSRRQRAAR